MAHLVITDEVTEAERDESLRLFSHRPALEPYRRSIRMAVNGTYAAWGDPVTWGDEVALIPPGAGG